MFASMVSPTLPLLYIVVYVVEFVHVLNIQSILYINATQGNLKYIRNGKVNVIRNIWLPFIENALWYRVSKQYFSYIVDISSTGGGNQITWEKPLTCPNPLINFSCDRHWLHMFCVVLKVLHEFGSLYFIKDKITCQSYMTFMRQFVYGTYSSKMLPCCFWVR